MKSYGVTIQMKPLRKLFSNTLIFFLPESLDPWPSLFSPCLRLRKLLSELAHPGTFLRTIALVSTSEFWSQNRGT